MTRVVEVVLEPVTAEAFAPFGQLIAAGEAPPVFEGPHIASWRMDFAADGGAELMFARYVHQEIRWTLMERHFNVTQSFIALNGASSVMAVAPPTARDGDGARPRPEAVRAFLVDGARGVMLWQGTWHALTRFPVPAAGADFALITGAATQRELERQNRDGTRPRLTEVVDFERTGGVGFAVVDPGRLLAGQAG